MKKILLVLSILFSITLYGQAPQAMNAFPYIYGATGYKNNSVDSNVVNFFGVKQGGNGKMVATPSFVSPKAISIGNGNITGTSSIAIGNSISVSDSSIGLGSSSAKHQMVLGNNTIDSSYIYGHTVIQNGLSLPTIQNATGLATDANGNVIQSSSIIETGGNYGTFFNTQTAAPLGFIGVSKGMGITKSAGKFTFFNSIFDGTPIGEDTAFSAYGVIDTSNPDNATVFSIQKQNDTTYSARINSAGNLEIEGFDSANLRGKNFLKLSVEDGKPIVLFDDDDSNSNLQINGLPTGSASDTFVVMEGNQMKKRIGSGGSKDSLSLKNDTLGINGSNSVFLNTAMVNRVMIDSIDTANLRNDNGSFIKLNNGTLICAYSHFGTNALDVGVSQIFITKSLDEGITWTTPTMLIDTINMGSYLPSFYKKSNGNILCVFFVREAITPANKSSIRAIEYSPDMSSIVTSIYTVYNNNEYNPVAQDRLYYDATTSRLLYPMSVLVSGTGTSTASVYTGKVLMSLDEGATWVDSSITTVGKLSSTGFGGALELGIVQGLDSGLILYYRTLAGNIYANKLNFSANKYTVSTVFNTGLYSENAMPSIKYSNSLKCYIGVVTAPTYPFSAVRKQIFLYSSANFFNWKLNFVVDRPTIGSVNNITLFELTNKFIVSYAYLPSGSNSALTTVLLSKSFISPASITQNVLTNPNASDTLNRDATTVELNTLTSSYANHFTPTYVYIRDSINSTNSVYGNVQYMKIFGNGKFFTAKHAVLSIQGALDNITMSKYTMLNINSPVTAFTAHAKVDTLTMLNIEAPAVGAQSDTPKVTYGIRQNGNYLNSINGKLGIGTAFPTASLDVVGQVIIHTVLFSSLPASPVTGTIAMISDGAASPTWHGTASGGGSIVTGVMWNGSNWIYW